MNEKFSVNFIDKSFIYEYLNVNNTIKANYLNNFKTKIIKNIIYWPMIVNTFVVYSNKNYTKSLRRY